MAKCIIVARLSFDSKLPPSLEAGLPSQLFESIGDAQTADHRWSRLMACYFAIAQVSNLFSATNSLYNRPYGMLKALTAATGQNANRTIVGARNVISHGILQRCI